MSKKRVGFVGCGFVGQIAHLENYSKLESCEIVALAEIREGLRTLVQEKYDIQYGFNNHTEMIAENLDLDLVVVVARRPNMGPIALDLLNAGVSVFTEKPICGSVEQAKRLLSVAEKGGGKQFVGYMRRQDPHLQKLKELLVSGRLSEELGPLTGVIGRCFAGNSYQGKKALIDNNAFEYPTDLASWRTSPEWVSNEENFLFDKFNNTYCHDINMLHFLFDDISVRSTNLKNANFGTVNFWSDSYDVSINFQVGDYQCSSWDESMELFFEKGSVKLTLPPAFDHAASSRLDFSDKKLESEVNIQTRDWPFMAQAAQLIQYVSDGSGNAIFATEALKDLGLIEEIWKMELGK